ncbi:MAG: FtsX-like permease family protein [Roseiflexaceae bacterium]|nr:ABC transporter permease [Roseiflexus sp.]MDW8213445.1 FtsX-like permease family protein [Roseiflexaceae bacterium]
MLRPRWRKVFADVWSNKTRTILVVLSIAVGVFAIGAIAGANALLTREMTAAYLAVNPADISIYPDVFDDELVRTVRRIPGVADAVGRRAVGVRLQTGPDQWRDMTIYIVRDFEEMRINKVFPVEGAWPPPPRTLLVERASLPLTGANIGDTVTIRLPDETLRRMRIAGTVATPNLVPAALTNQTYAFATFGTLEWLGQPEFYDELNITVTGDRFDKEHIAEVATLVRNKIESSGRTVYFTYLPEPGRHPAHQVLQPLFLLLGFLGALSLFASCFLVINTISALLTQQVRQIGVMKAIGARTRDVVVMYLASVLLLGVLALLLAMPLAYLVAAGLTVLISGMMNTDVTSLAMPLEVWLLMIAVGLMVPLLAGAFPVLGGARVTVHEALSSYGLGKGRFGRSRIDHLLQRIHGLSRPLMLSLRNTFRRKERLALTMVTLTLSGIIFMSVFSVRNSLQLTLDDALKYFNFHILGVFNGFYRTEQIEREALAVPGVIAAESWGFDTVRRVRPNDTESDAITMYAVPAETRMIIPTVLEGRWLLPEDENALVINSSVLGLEPDIKVGDTVTLKIDRRETEWKVVGIVRGIGGQAILYTHYPYFARMRGFTGRAVAVTVQIDPPDVTNQERVAKELEAHYKSVGIRMGAALTLAILRQQNELFFNILVAFLLFMALLLATVGGLGLMGTMSINVLERTREIGVLRAIGASNGAVLGIIITEGVIIGALSWALAMIVAVPLAKVISDSVGMAFFQTPLSFSFSVGGALIWLVLVTIIAAVASLLPAYNATRLTVREVLAYE